jgi:hypothetical protein
MITAPGILSPLSLAASGWFDGLGRLGLLLRRPALLLVLRLVEGLLELVHHPFGHGTPLVSALFGALGLGQAFEPQLQRDFHPVPFG